MSGGLKPLRQRRRDTFHDLRQMVRDTRLDHEQGHLRRARGPAGEREVRHALGEDREGLAQAFDLVRLEALRQGLQAARARVHGVTSTGLLLLDAELRRTVALKPKHPEAWRHLADHLLADDDAAAVAKTLAALADAADALAAAPDRIRAGDASGTAAGTF